MAAAMMRAPPAIRYLPGINPLRRPMTPIITAVTTPPGDKARPAQVAVYP